MVLLKLILIGIIGDATTGFKLVYTNDAGINKNGIYL